MEIIGHKKIVRYLDACLNKGTISHAYFFCGPEHIGKFTLAKIFAQKLTGTGDVQIDPDLHILSPEIEETKGVLKKKSIQVEKIRNLKQEMSLTSYSGKHKVAIINDAEYMTVSAQNALLKTLEEPSAGCVIILVCHNEEKILPTIKSRCVIKRFNLLSAEEMDSKTDPCFLGRPGLSQNIEELAKKETAKKDLENLMRQNVNEKLEAAEKMSRDLPKTLETLDIWSALLRSQLLFGNTFRAIKKIRALTNLELIGKSLLILKGTNANARLILENLLLNL